MAIAGYEAKYNGVSIEGASISIRYAVDYGLTGLYPTRLIEQFVIRGFLQNDGDIETISEAKKDLIVKVGNNRMTRTANDCIDGSPSPEVNFVKQMTEIGGDFLAEIELSVRCITILTDSPLYSNELQGLIEVDINYNNEVTEKGLNNWSITGTASVREGFNVDEYREKIVETYIGQPVGDLVRKLQTFAFNKNKTVMTFSIRDEEGFYPPPNSEVRTATFKLDSSTDGIWMNRALSFSVQPHKTATGISTAKTFITKILKLLLFRGIDITRDKPLLNPSNMSHDSMTGEMTGSASFKVVVPALGSTGSLLDNPNAEDLSKVLFFGISTSAELSQIFITGSKPLPPRGYSPRYLKTFSTMKTDRVIDLPQPVAEPDPIRKKGQADVSKSVPGNSSVTKNKTGVADVKVKEGLFEPEAWFTYELRGTYTKDLADIGVAVVNSLVAARNLAKTLETFENGLDKRFKAAIIKYDEDEKIAIVKVSFFEGGGHMRLDDGAVRTKIDQDVNAVLKKFLNELRISVVAILKWTGREENI